MTCVLEHTVKYFLDIFPYRVTVGSDRHTAFNACVFDKLGFFYYVGVPLGEILVH